MRLACFLPVAVIVTMAAPQASADTIELTFENGAFHPDHVTAPAGQKLHFRIHNGDSRPFNFEIEELRITPKVKPGAVVDARSMSAPQPGVYRFIAEFPGVDEDKSPGGQLEIK